MEIDQMARGFRTRLTTTFDGVLRKALLDVMDIFESTVHDFKMLMEQKEARIQKLQGKLVAAELKRKNPIRRSDRGSKTSPGGSDAAKVQAVKQGSSSASKAPDDWCAPLGCETTPKKAEVGCPSVRLRPLTIPVPNIPILRHEIVNCDLDLYLKYRKRRMSKRLSALKEGTNPVFGTKISSPQNPMLTIKQESSDQTDFEMQKNVAQHGKNHNGKVKKKESAKGKKRTKVCRKVFISKKEQNLHADFHNCCVGCRTIFQHASSLVRHKLRCKELNRVVAKTPTSAQTQTQTTIKTENAQFLISSMDPDTIRSTFAKSARVSINGAMLAHTNVGGHFK